MASTVMGARSTTNSSGFSQTGFFISEEPLQVHAGIKRRDRRSIAVEHQRPPLGEFADAAFAALAPAGMVHIGVHIGIKAVFLRVGLVPARRRLPLGKAHLDDRFDRLEAIFPWHRSEEHTSELQSLMRISYAV